MSDEKVEIVDESLKVEPAARTKRLKSSPGELPTGGLLEEMKKIKAERDKKLAMENQAHEEVQENKNYTNESEEKQMKIFVKVMDGSRADLTVDVMCDPGDTIGILVDRVLVIRGMVMERSGHIARDSHGRELGHGNTLAEAGVESGDTVYLYCKDVQTKNKVPTGQGCPWHLVSLICGLACLLTSAGVVIAWCLNTDPVDRYLVLLDAGSVHTSVFTYRYSYTEHADRGVNVTETNYCDLGQTGISSFKANPMGASQFISSHPCVLSSISKVPPTSRPVSSLLLGSTAGMRVLDLASPETAKEILGNLTQELKSVSRNMVAGARILSGEEEGLDGWVTANYLGGGLKIGEQMGALDWGGASAQITRVEKEQLSGSRNISLYGKQYPLMARSNLCYGQAEALARHRAGLVYTLYINQSKLMDDEGKVDVEDPCLPQGAVIAPIPFSQLYGSPCTTMLDASFMNKARSSNKTINFISSQNQTLCSSLVLEQFTPQSCTAQFVALANETSCLDPSTIPPPGDIKYLAMSTYWYLTSGLNLPTSFPYSTFTNITSTLCSSNVTSPVLTSLGSVADIACFQAVFMRHLLTTAYHFNSTTWPQISFVKRVADAEVGWGLGHAIVQANSLDSVGGKQYVSFPLLVLMLSVSGLLLLASVAAVCQGRSVSRSYSRLLEETV